MSDVKYLRSYEKQLGYIPSKTYSQIANDILAFYKLHKSFDLADFISYASRTGHYDIVLRIISKYEREKINDGDFENYLSLLRKWIKDEQINALLEKQKSTVDPNEKNKITDMIIKLMKESDE